MFFFACMNNTETLKHCKLSCLLSIVLSCLVYWPTVCVYDSIVCVAVLLVR